jgi:hypothetical protein
MAIITTAEALAFLDITAAEVGPGNISIADGTYTLSEVQAAMDTALNAFSTPTPTGRVYLAGSYDEDAETFTIDSTSDETLIYEYTLSGGSYYFTFSNEQGEQTPAEEDLDPDGQVEAMVNAVNQFIANYCKRTFDLGSHSEYHSGSGPSFFCVNNFPITAVDRLCFGRRAAVRVCNTNTSSKASVSVTATGVMLNYNGSTDSTILFANYVTLTTIVAAINAISGWSADLVDSSYGAFLSSELLPMYGKSCINSAKVGLEIPEDGEYDFEVDAEAGIIKVGDALPKGFRNIRIDYTAGYSSANMPEDLKLAAKIILKDWWDKHNESSFNLSDYSIGGMSKSFEAMIPKEAEHILEAFRRHRL